MSIEPPIVILPVLVEGLYHTYVPHYLVAPDLSTEYSSDRGTPLAVYSYGWCRWEGFAWLISYLARVL
jgi:hypothetical protein